MPRSADEQMREKLAKALRAARKLPAATLQLLAVIVMY